MDSDLGELVKRSATVLRVTGDHDRRSAGSYAEPGDDQTDPRAHARRTEVDKALCYIVRDGELLVIAHPDASSEEVGIQVPGGTVRDGETPEQAALREAREETGLDDFVVVGKLGEIDYDITPHRRELQHRHVFHLEVRQATSARWTGTEDHDGQQPPTRLECFWLPLASAHVLQAGHGALVGRLYDELLDHRSE